MAQLGDLPVWVDIAAISISHSKGEQFQRRFGGQRRSNQLPSHIGDDREIIGVVLLDDDAVTLRQDCARQISFIHVLSSFLSATV